MELDVQLLGLALKLVDIGIPAFDFWNLESLDLLVREQMKNLLKDTLYITYAKETIKTVKL
jgi:hypothetical protein